MADSGSTPRDINLRVRINAPGENSDLAMDISMPLSAKVEDLKQEIRNRMTTKPTNQQQRIILRGHVLRDHQTLRETCSAAWATDPTNPLALHMIARPGPNDRIPSASAPATPIPARTPNRTPAPTNPGPSPLNQQLPQQQQQQQHPLFPQPPFGPAGFQQMQFPYNTGVPAPGGFMPPPFAQTQGIFTAQNAHIQRLHEQMMQRHQMIHNAALQANNMRANAGVGGGQQQQQQPATTDNASGGVGGTAFSTAAGGTTGQQPQPTPTTQTSTLPNMNDALVAPGLFSTPANAPAATTSSNTQGESIPATASSSNLQVPAPDPHVRSTSAPSIPQPTDANRPSTFMPPSRITHIRATSFTTSFSPLNPYNNPQITSRLWSSAMTPTLQNTTNENQQYYLLMGPEGPSAVLLGPQHQILPSLTSQFPLPPPMPLPDPQVFAALSRAGGGGVGGGADMSAIHRAQRVQRSVFWYFIAHLAGIDLVPQPGQPPLTGDQIAERIRTRISHFWLLVRLIIGVVLFTGGTDWRRNIAIYAVAAVIFVWQTGMFNAWLTPLLRMVNFDHNAPQQPANPPAAAGAPAVANPNNPNAPAPAPAAGAAPAPAEPNPRDAAVRLIRRDNEVRATRLRNYIELIQRGVWIFMASLVPGLGERVGEARAARQREIDAQNAAANPPAPAQPTDNNNNNEGEGGGEGGEGPVIEAEADRQEHVIQQNELEPELEEQLARPITVTGGQA